MRELARIRWDREKQEAARLRAQEDLAGSSDRVALVRVPIPIGAIMSDLGSRAKRGDTAAARELRAWLSDFPPDDAAADASDLDHVQRSRIAAILARALAEDEESLQAQGIEGGTQDGFDSSPEGQSAPADPLPPEDGTPTDARGSRPLVAESMPPTPAPDGSHAPDGTVTPHQMDVDECIAEAERG